MNDFENKDDKEELKNSNGNQKNPSSEANTGTDPRITPNEPFSANNWKDDPYGRAEENEVRNKAENAKREEPGKDEPKARDNQDGKSEKKKNVYDEYRYWGGNKNSKDGGKGPQFKGGKPNKFALVVFVLLIVSFGFMIFTDSAGAGKQSVSYSKFLYQVESDNIMKVNIYDSSKIEFQTYDGFIGETRMPMKDQDLLPTLKAHQVEITGAVEPTPFWYILIQLLPWVIFVFMMVMIFRQTSAAGGQKMMGNLGKSHAQKFEKGDNVITFKDVAGQKEAKYELEEVVDFLKKPERFVKIGAKIPKGVLLVGPPGTGKTLLAKAVAGEAGVTFLHTSGSDFVEMFVGMGAARVRDLFADARKNAPCIIFIDELDAVGRARGTGLGGGHDEREQTLNQMLVEMDGFSSDPGIIVIAATNRPDVLDPALLRPGRFDRQVTVELPDVQERLDVLRIHTRKVHLSDDVDLQKVARATPGSSGADLANLVNEAALFAAREDRMQVNMRDFERARDKIILGVARESRFMTIEEKRATAYHEGGHTLLHYYLPGLDPLHKVTIIPHGRALGITMSLPEKDTYSLNQTMLESRIKMIMGGYIAEKLVYGETTTGPSNDIQKATELAHRMVTEWGMSDLGFIGLANDDEPIFLGRDIAQHKNFSEHTAMRIDEEVLKIMKRCMDHATAILTEHRDQLDELTERLVEKETLDDAEIREMFGFPPVEHITELK